MGGRLTEEEFSKTIEIKGVTSEFFTRKFLKHRPKYTIGITTAFRQTSGNKKGIDPNAQAVLKFYGNQLHLTKIYNRGKLDINRWINEEFIKYLQSDRVRSARDHALANSQNSIFKKKYIIDTPLIPLENTAFDGYIKHATRLNNTHKEDMPKMARIYGESET